MTALLLLFFGLMGLSVTKFQSVSCEIKFAHAHVRARPHVCNVCAKRLPKRACNVRACGRFKVCDVRKQFRTFLGDKGPNFGLFWAKFASKLPFCHKCACAGAK